MVSARKAWEHALLFRRVHTQTHKKKEKPAFLESRSAKQARLTNETTMAVRLCCKLINPGVVW